MGQALENLPTHDSNEIFFIDVPSSRMISEDTKIVAELSKESVSGLTDGIKGFFVDGVDWLPTDLIKADAILLVTPDGKRGYRKL